MTPPSATGHGYVSLGVSISGPHGEHHGSPGSLFRYEEPIILTTFSPTQGPMAGGTALTMSAGACGQLFCRFSSGGGEHAFTRGIPGYAPEHNVVVRGPGPLLVPASRLSSDLVACSTPTQDTPGFASVRLETVDRVIISPEQFYRYMIAPEVSHIKPRVGTPSGGTRVEVHGRNFVQSSVLYCSFGDALVRAEWITSLLVLCISPQRIGGNDGSVLFGITNDNALSFSRQAVNYTFIALPTLSTVVPRMGPVIGGTLVTLLGSGFNDNSASAAFCRFNTSLQTTTPATALGSTSLICRTPPSRRQLHDRWSSIEVGLASSDYTSGSSLATVFEYHEAFALTRVVPSGGPIAGGTTIFVEGEHFLLTSPLSCAFGGGSMTATTVAATVLTSTQLSCITPTSFEGPSQLQIGVNGSDFGVTYLTYRFYPTPIVSIASPLTGPQAGGNLVQIFGYGFRNSPSLACLLGNTSVPAHFMSSNSLNCSAPPHAPRVVAVRATNDGIGMSPSNISYSYKEDMVASMLVPSRGPAQGPINISVLGRHLARASVCTWQNAAGGLGANNAMEVTTESYWMSATEVLCSTPSIVPPQSEILLTLVVPGSRIAGLSYSTVPDPFATSLTPSLGPDLGGTTVTVHGQGFDSTAECIFGESTRVFTRLIDSTRLQCIAPAKNRSVGVPLLTSFKLGNKLHSIVVRNDLMFRYHPTCQISSLAPSIGPEAGGAIVRITGLDYVRGGSSSALVHFGHITVPCATIDDTTVECLTPRHEPRTVAVTLSFNGGLDSCVTTAGALMYTFSRTTVTKLHPVSGPAAGGTLITISGTNLGHSAALSCMLSTRVLSAKWVSPSTMECYLPPGVIGSHRLAAISNGRRLGNFAFEYQAVARVSSLSPSIGLTTGGTMVNVVGAHFSARSASMLALRCRFNLTDVPCDDYQHLHPTVPLSAS